MENKYKELDLDKLDKYLSELKPEPANREWLVQQGCLTNGIVQRSTLDLNLCDNKECVSCQQFHESLKDVCNGKEKN